MNDRPPLPHADPPDWRRYLLWSVIWLTFIATLGYAASTGNLGFLENAVVVAAEPNRDRVTLHGPEPAVIQVKLTLRNSTANAVTLSAPSACKIFRWQIFSRDRDMIQTVIPKDDCPPAEAKAFVAPGQSIEEFYAILLEANRYKPGQDYLVHFYYWGYEGEFQFKAE